MMLLHLSSSYMIFLWRRNHLRGTVSGTHGHLKEQEKQHALLDLAALRQVHGQQLQSQHSCLCVHSSQGRYNGVAVSSKSVTECWWNVERCWQGLWDMDILYKNMLNPKRNQQGRLSCWYRDVFVHLSPAFGMQFHPVGGIYDPLIGLLLALQH